MRPKYRDLPDGDAAGVFGESDALGCLNLLTPEAVAHAASLVRTGKVFSLNQPVNWPDPPIFGRKAVEHHVIVTKRGNLDDYLDTYFPQASSQWDGYLHIRDPELGRYNRRPDSEIGIEKWAERGIAGRGVLLDVERHLRGTDDALSWEERQPITAQTLRECMEAQEVHPLSGDILLLRTGWTTAYKAASPDERAELTDERWATPGGHRAWPGLDPTSDMAEFLWDWGVSAVAADNPSLEVAPVVDESIHPKMLGRLGIPIGELWNLDHLASDCADDGRYEHFMTSAPINLPGGIGSPANAIAIK